MRRFDFKDSVLVVALASCAVGVYMLAGLPVVLVVGGLALAAAVVRRGGGRQ